MGTAKTTTAVNPAQAGLAPFPIVGIGASAKRDVGVNAVASSLPSGAEPKAPEAHSGSAEAIGFHRILSRLRDHSGVDFLRYKPGTLQRRILRRMGLHNFTTLAAYAHFLEDNARELDALYSDVLIKVTSFFRNPEAFAALQGAMAATWRSTPKSGPVRIWVPGCSSGQEAYSIAMAVAEVFGSAGGSPAIQIFATDLNEMVLDKARAGLYSKSLVREVSPERLGRFFTEEKGGFRIRKFLRDTCVFARQNLLVEPPFARLDLISCRNLLIYIEPAWQLKVLPVFHYALKPAGILFLGTSESIGAATDLFEPLDKRQAIYVKKAGPTPALGLEAFPKSPRWRVMDPNSSAAQHLLLGGEETTGPGCGT